jgi:thiamine biosynthesis lipoprotein ApbE
VNELVFACMGTTVRLLAEQPLAPVRAGIERLAALLTRFDPASELCARNADPRAEVPASPLLRRAVQAARLGARRTGGLADPTLLGAVEAAIATAVAPTALEAEALAKAAVLAGPRGARRFLAAGGGIVVGDDGRAEVVEQLGVAA